MIDQQKVLQTFFVGGRLISWPAKRQKQLIVLEQLLQDFQPGVDYPEADVNRIILAHYEDFCLIRRLFVDLGYMHRVDAVYRVNPQHLWPALRQQLVQTSDGSQ